MWRYTDCPIAIWALAMIHYLLSYLREILIIISLLSDPIQIVGFLNPYWNRICRTKYYSARYNHIWIFYKYFISILYEEYLLQKYTKNISRIHFGVLGQMLRHIGSSWQYSYKHTSQNIRYFVMHQKENSSHFKRCVNGLSWIFIWAHNCI